MFTVKVGSKTKVIKEIKVNLDKCTGCRACELACSAFHSVPKYSSQNPGRSRIVVIMDETRDVFVPIRAGSYARAECSGRNLYVIKEREYDECTFCPASCPSRDYFKEPDSGLPLKCDMCEETPPLSEPMCVQACQPGALTYEERVEERPEAEGNIREMRLGLESLINKHGLEKVMDTVARMSRKSA